MRVSPVDSGSIPWMLNCQLVLPPDDAPIWAKWRSARAGHVCPFLRVRKNGTRVSPAAVNGRFRLKRVVPTAPAVSVAGAVSC